MKLYLAGPMTGHALWNFPAFDRAAADLRTWGFDVISPAELDRDAGFDEHTTTLPGGFMAEAMRRDITALLEVDGIVLMDGWRTSSGARFELQVATMLGLPAYVIVDGGVACLPVESVLEEAQRLVHGDRRDDYGHPADDFARTGRMWGAILGVDDIDPALVGLCMAALKISREVNQPKRDNRTDLAGYAECVDLVRQRQQK